MLICSKLNKVKFPKVKMFFAYGNIFIMLGCEVV